MADKDAWEHVSGARAAATVSLAREAAGAHAGRPALLIQLEADDARPDAARPPLHVCLVLDVSGSMGADASVQTSAGANESSGLSVLDITKHAVRAVLAVLREQDSASLVVFHTDAEVLCARVRCGAPGLALLETTLARQTPRGTTNLWEGVRLGLELTREDGAGDDGGSSVMFVLTDGQPNIAPPRGTLAALQKYAEAQPHGELPCALHSFGFGYTVDSELLSAMAREGGGGYSFIPDPGLVGTVLIHACANALAALGRDARVDVRLPAGARVADDALELLGAQFAVARESWGLSARVGPVGFGQRRALLLPMDVDGGAASDDAALLRGSEVEVTMRDGGARVAAAVRVVQPLGSARRSGAAEAHEELAVAGLRAEARAALARCVVDVLAARQSGARGGRAARADVAAGAAAERCAAAVAAAAEHVQAVREAARARGAAEDECAALDGILADVTGQVDEAACNDGFFARWGAHYLRSLLGAHAREQCNNFKDPGVQPYARGELLLALRAQAEAAFSSLPPPKPSVRPKAPPLSPARMRQMYMNQANGCVAGAGRAALVREGSPDAAVRVDALRAGDAVRTGLGGVATVRCVVRSCAPPDGCALTQLPRGGPLITAHHPVWDHGTRAWAFPCEVAPRDAELSLELEAVYSVVLDGGAALQVDGWPVIALGHGIQDDAVAAHPYLATARVLEDLARLPGWARGSVELVADAFERDPATGLICGLRLHTE